MKIETHITYVKYPFSPEATKYSKKVAMKKVNHSILIGFSIICSIVNVCFLLWLIVFLVGSNDNIAMWVRYVFFILALGLGIALAIFTGWKVENAYWGRQERKIEQAITRDIMKLEKQYSHEEVEALRRSLLMARRNKIRDANTVESRDGERENLTAEEIGQGLIRSTIPPKKEIARLLIILLALSIIDIVRGEYVFSCLYGISVLVAGTVIGFHYRKKK